MKILIALTVVLLSMNVFAVEFKTVRYSTSYQSFDRVLFKHFGFSENHHGGPFCGNDGRQFHTCFAEDLRTERVFIEERMIDSRNQDDDLLVESKVTVYTGKNYVHPYVTYTIHNGAVARRHFHIRHRNYGWHKYYKHQKDYYHSAQYKKYYHSYSYFQIDWGTDDAEILNAKHFMATEIQIMALCSDYEDEEIKKRCSSLGSEKSLNTTNLSSLYKEFEKDANSNI